MERYKKCTIKNTVLNYSGVLFLANIKANTVRFLVYERGLASWTRSKGNDSFINWVWFLGIPCEFKYTLAPVLPFVPSRDKYQRSVRPSGFQERIR